MKFVRSQKKKNNKKTKFKLVITIVQERGVNGLRALLAASPVVLASTPSRGPARMAMTVQEVIGRQKSVTKEHHAQVRVPCYVLRTLMDGRHGSLQVP